ncbi:hypothetical protein BU23DRAFT_175593 [Bimuria novae-zelandiae CBS 107.79]|uniref:Uncharacterized protein n=1 Tax=Bimuria novae-zelandiae CBS 107.79 TaxID=1447943 RepID=A0A6A5VE77_9PLEO|nr:hypothetical protein BU23DRAFT_175593 [Bimuria novae-zelandiae CBS 107.79]
MDENSGLHYHVSDQARELDLLVQSKRQLMTELQDKEKAIQELGLTHEQRLLDERKSKDDELDELRRIQLRSESDHEDQIQKRDSAMNDLKQEQQSRWQSELRAKDSRIEELQKDKAGFAASLAAVEAELFELRKNKEEFEHLVETLNEKIKQMEEAEKANHPQESSESATPAFSDAKSHQDDADARPSTPSPPQRTVTLEGDHIRGSAEADRPLSGTEPQGTWTSEIDRVRYLRDQTANQLKGIKKVKSDLKQSLKDSEAQLHELEQSIKPKRPPTVLRKRTFPSPQTPTRTPSRGPETPTPSPSRPATAGLLHAHNTSYQHNSLYQPHQLQDNENQERPITASPLRRTQDPWGNVIEAPPASPSPNPRRWSSLPRPHTSKSNRFSTTLGTLGNVDGQGTVDRPKSSLGGHGLRSTTRGEEREKEKKKWSVLRRLLRREGSKGS